MRTKITQSPCTVFALMFFKNICLSSDLALIEAVWIASWWQLKWIRDQKMEHEAKMSTLSTVNASELTSHLSLCCAKWCSYVYFCFLVVFLYYYSYTVFIIFQVRMAILIMLLQRHNVANHTVLKLTAPWYQVWWCIALIISNYDSEIDL